MTDDLVQRLRRTYRKEYAPTGSMCGDNSNKPFPFPILATEVPVNPDGHEAADRIEDLRAEIERLREKIAMIADVVALWAQLSSPAFPTLQRGRLDQAAWDQVAKAVGEMADDALGKSALQETSGTFTRSSDT